MIREPSDDRTTPEVWDGALPDVWDGAVPSEEALKEEDDQGFERLYGRSPEDLKGPGQSHADRSKRNDKLPHDLGWIGHGVLPFACIAMVCSLLFFLYDVRSVFLPGSLELKWIGVCFVVATVLTARYARLGGGMFSAGFYSSLLAFVTILVMAFSPWEAPQVGMIGPLSNAVIIGIVWRFAGRLTTLLSKDLDPEDEPDERLFGLERLEMERLERLRDGERASIYEIGRRARRRRQSREGSDPRQARLAVLRLSALGLVIFALGEPALLAGHELAAQRALGAMIVFLASGALILGAASSMHNAERLKDLGGEPALWGIAGRLAVVTVCMVVVLSVALTTPGLSLRGRGDIAPVTPNWWVEETETSRGSEPQPDEGAEARSEQSEGDRQARESGDGDAGEEQGAQGAEGDAGPESDTSGASDASGSSDSSDGADGGQDGDSSLDPGSAAAVLARLGHWLKWPLLVAVALVALISAWRSAGHWSSLLKAFWQGFWNSLRGAWAGLFRFGFFRRSEGRGADGKGLRPPRDLSTVFKDLDGLLDLEPREAVLVAYGRMLDVWRAAGHQPAENQTPAELVVSLPRSLAAVREPSGRLTDIYVRAAFGHQPTPVEDRRAAVDVLRELRQILLIDPGPAGPRL